MSKVAHREGFLSQKVVWLYVVSANQWEIT